MRKRILLFSLSLIVFSGNNESFAQSSKRLDFCGLFGSKVDTTLVNTQAILFVPGRSPAVAESADEYFYSNGCNNRDFFAYADFSGLKDLKVVLREEKKFSDNNGPRMYVVSFEGRLLHSLPPKFGHLSFLRAKFEVKSIKSSTALTNPNNGPNMKARAPMLEASSELSVVDSELMLSMFRSQLKPADIAILITEQSKILINQENISGEDFLTKTFIENSGNLEYGITDITQNGRSWKVSGHIVNRLGGNEVRTMKYENEYFRHKDNSWRLRVLVASIS